MAKLKTPILLHIKRDGQETRIEEYNENIIKIGKLSSVTLRLDDPGINRIHAVIEVTAEEEAQVIDMGSSKGTKVNGERVHKTKIVTGDELLLGETTLKIFIGPAAVEAAKQGQFDEDGADEVATSVTEAPSQAEDPLKAVAQLNDSLLDPNLLLGQSDNALKDSTRVSNNPLEDVAALSAVAQEMTLQTPPVADAPAEQPMAQAPPQVDAMPQIDTSALVAALDQAGTNEATTVGLAPSAPEVAPANTEAEGTQVAAVPQMQAAPVVQQTTPTTQLPEQAAAAPAVAQAAPVVQQTPAVVPQPAPVVQQAAPVVQQPAMVEAAPQFAAPAAAPMQFQSQPPMQQQFQSQPPQQFQSQPPQAAYQAPQQAMLTGNFQGQAAQFQAPATGHFQSQAPGFQQPQFAQTAQPPLVGYAAEPAPVVIDDPALEETQEVLEVRVMWGERVLNHAHFYDHKQKITVGESSKNDFAISADALGTGLDSFDLIEAKDGRILINFTDAMGGQVQIKEQLFTLDQIKQSQKVQQTVSGYQFALPTQSKVHLVVGQITFEISFVSAPRRLPVSVMGNVDHQLARAMGASLLIHLSLLLYILFAPTDLDTLGEDLFKQNDRFTRLIIHPEEKKKEKPKRRKSGGGTAAKGKKGKMGKKKEKVVKNNRAGQKKKNPDGRSPIDIKKAQEDVMKSLKKKGLLGLMGGGGGVTSKLLDAKGRGGDDANALGGLIGSVVGKSGGAGGLAALGSGGVGGGGKGGNSVGVGKLGTYGRGGGKGGRGWGRGGLRRKRKKKLQVTTGPAQVFGSLDKKIIRQIIRQHRSQIKYCYESQLARRPNLQGTIKVFFEIAPTGRVSRSSIRKSTMNNDRVEDCLKMRIKFLRFPRPKGGGVVRVTYPFYFKPS